MGYYRAGFEIVGVDNKPQRHFPFEFIQGDALEIGREIGHNFDVIHASPPCQAYTVLKALQSGKEYVDMIDVTRLLLGGLQKPYVIENVVGAPLVNPLTLCGSSFGLNIWRHRLFETSPMSAILIGMLIFSNSFTRASSEPSVSAFNMMPILSVNIFMLSISDFILFKYSSIDPLITV